MPLRRQAQRPRPDHTGSALWPLDGQAEVEYWRALALVDELTGLPNRRAFMGELQAALDEGRAGGAPATVLLVDVDAFQAVNDSVGHVGGDAVLRQVGQRLHEIIAPSGVAGRIGGDEFAALVLHGSAAAADIGRLATVLGRPVALDDGRLVSIRVSIGRTRLEPQDQVESVLERADRSMSTAKRAARRQPFAPVALDQVEGPSLPPEIMWLATGIMMGRGAWSQERARSALSKLAHLTDRTVAEVCLDLVRAVDQGRLRQPRTRHQRTNPPR